ncbi:MAG: cytochrome c [Acidimicrobiia bacterium]|nr:MAG: cytochrome c [Acidimicrobiia bacterium]
MKNALLLLAVLLLAACGSGATDTASGGGEAPAVADAANGETVYLNTCASCHGADALGVDGLGKALAGSSFVADASEADLVALITTGRPSSDPANSTGVDMPPKGGNPSLSEQSIRDVVAYLKTLD